MVAHETRAARAALEERCYDAIVADLHLGRESGAALLAEVAVRWPGMKRVLVSGDVELEEVDADVHLFKPFSFRELVALLQDGPPATGAVTGPS